MAEERDRGGYMNGAIRRSLLARLGLIAFGAVAALFVLEALLQMGALVTRWTGRDLPSVVSSSGRRRLLCLGDSNTYGFYLERSEAYPQVFAGLANVSADTPTIEVLNLGQPGINSSLLRNQLPDMLQTFRPDVVTLMVGANDFWTVPGPVTGETPVGWGMTNMLWRVSRVYRFLYMLRRSAQNAALVVSVPAESEPDLSSGQGRIEYGGRVFSWEWRPQEGGNPDRKPLLANLTAMTALVRQAGAEPILLTYPSEQAFYRVANDVLRQTAAATATPLIDLGAAFRPLCDTPECPDLFFPDQHPTAAGHRRAAEFILASRLVANRPWP